MCNTLRRGVFWLPRGDNDDDEGAEGAKGMVVESQPEPGHGGEADRERKVLIDRERKVLMVGTANGRGGGGVVVVGGEEGVGERGVGGCGWLMVDGGVFRGSSCSLFFMILSCSHYLYARCGVCTPNRAPSIVLLSLLSVLLCFSFCDLPNS